VTNPDLIVSIFDDDQVAPAVVSTGKNNLARITATIPWPLLIVQSAPTQGIVLPFIA
jgi:hypothetical protein